MLSALASSATARCRCGSRSAALYTSRPAGHVCVLDFVQRPSRNHERRWASTAQAAQPPASSSAAAGAGPLHSSSSTDKSSATDAGAVQTPPKSRPNLAVRVQYLTHVPAGPQYRGWSITSPCMLVVDMGRLSSRRWRPSRRTHLPSDRAPASRSCTTPGPLLSAHPRPRLRTRCSRSTAFTIAARLARLRVYLLHGAYLHGVCTVEQASALCAGCSAGGARLV